MVIFIFTGIIWFITNRSQTAQYQNTDLIYDYQNLILHELLVRDWVNSFDDGGNFSGNIEEANFELYEIGLEKE